MPPLVIRPPPVGSRHTAMPDKHRCPVSGLAKLFPPAQGRRCWSYPGLGEPPGAATSHFSVGPPSTMFPRIALNSRSLDPERQIPGPGMPTPLCQACPMEGTGQVPHWSIAPLQAQLCPGPNTSLKDAEKVGAGAPAAPPAHGFHGSLHLGLPLGGLLQAHCTAGELN